MIGCAKHYIVKNKNCCYEFGHMGMFCQLVCHISLSYLYDVSYGVNITNDKWSCCCEITSLFLFYIGMTTQFLLVCWLYVKLIGHNYTTNPRFCLLYITNEFVWAIRCGYIIITNVRV